MIGELHTGFILFMNNCIFNNSKFRLLQCVTIFICISILSISASEIIHILSNIPAISSVLGASNEVRNYVSFRLVHFIMEGVNPYTEEFFNQVRVPFVYLYSSLYPLIVAVICKMFGVSVISGFYIANFIIFVGTAFNIWLISRAIFSKYKILFFFCIVICTSTFFSLFILRFYLKV